MKFLIVGLGSMGKRRIRNLQKLGFDNLIGFDIKKERLDEVSKKFKVSEKELMNYFEKEMLSI